ncbi:hypothetical protein Misp03_01130 [Microbispora sp. NBRC 16548]|nr:hypothetical protein Misp03_01130 [Microbispora sp. NBRC 16548]
MLCGVTEQNRASFAPEMPGASDSAYIAAYCGTVSPNGRSTRLFSAISACSARLMALPGRHATASAILASSAPIITLPAPSGL